MTMVNWAACEHQAIYSMLHTSVEPGDIGDGVHAWREQGQNTEKVLTGLAPDLNRIVSGGWRGRAADRAINALGPIDQWSARVADATELTTVLMDAAGFCAGQAKATVPPPKSYDVGEALRSFASGGMTGLVDDVVAQEQQQSEAHAEAVRIMTTVYSAPINEYRAAVPTYPQLVDPTLQPPEQPPKPGPAPGSGYPGGGAPGGGVGTQGGGHVAHTPSAPIAHTLSAPTARPQPAPVALQSVTSGVPAPQGSGQVTPDQVTHQPQHVGGQVAEAVVAAAAGVPVMGQIVGDAWRARAAGGGVWAGGGGHASGMLAGAGHPVEFGPRPTSPTAEIAQDPMGPPGRNLSGMEAGRAGAGQMMAPMMGGGRGKGGEDSEHRRPSYLIEMDDVFTDGRTVAPAVIGENLPEQDD